ncbi:hypothetical protein AMELA_G00241240 [Ameiurus melas]|uniref:G-protein coupled receptors family 1 profile domain-containing protein n=1 Tax=Ameiurus melas TaxID=219545 RepID=A0A7J5ZVR4_AMEME|nr:hypothetical protein AMELA_G00241240 [Ameiurus melas]
MSGNNDSDISTDYSNNDSFTTEQNNLNAYLNSIRMLYIIGYFIICTLGLVLNFSVIIAGSYYHRNYDTGKWVLGLAGTHLICSAFLPLQLLYSWNYFNWHYGTALCKVSSYIFYASLFSTAGILTLWSVSNGIGKNKCTIFGHSSAVLIMILCSWTFAAVLSIPSLYSRELRMTFLGEQCIDDYDLNDEKTTKDGKRNLTIVVCYRFLVGILIPAFLISICYCCERSYKECKNEKQITCLVKVSFFVCWTPLLLMGLLQLNNHANVTGLSVATVLAAAHCCVNPVIYLLMSRDIKMNWINPTQ